MLLQRLSAADMWGRVIEHIAFHTDTTTVGEPEKNMPSPFYYVELSGMEPVNTKTQFIDRFNFAIHCISKPTHPFSPLPVMEMVQELEEAMTQRIPLPPRFALLNQEYGGIEAIKKDETNEGHAVCAFTFDVSYGFRIK